MHRKTPQSDGDARIARVAERQCGLITLAQLLGLGFTYMQIEWRVNHGRLHRLHHGVYAVGHRQLSVRGELLAALLANGPEAFLSHDTAAGRWDLRTLSTRRIEVTVPAHYTRTHRGLIMHRTTSPLHRGEVTTRLGLRVSTVPRLLIELAARETPLQLEALITMAVRKQVFHPHDIEAAIARHARRPGIGVLKAAVARYRPGPDRKSGLERSVDRWLRTRPDIPDPERNVYVGRWEIDCLWREQRVVMELDGRPYHVAVQDFDKDGYKDTQLQLMGLRPMRVSDFRWEHDRPTVIRDLLALLGLGSLPGA